MTIKFSELAMQRVSLSAKFYQFQQQTGDVQQSNFQDVHNCYMNLGLSISTWNLILDTSSKAEIKYWMRVTHEKNLNIYV